MKLVNVGYHATNYYMLISPTTYLLIDAGWPESLAQFRHELKRKDLRLQDIGYLLCTHYHPDHCGLAQEIKQAGAQLLIMEAQRAAVPPQITLEHTLTLSLAASRSFLARCGFDGEIVCTPGHSEDSVSLVLDSGIAFTGDLSPLFDSSDPAYQVTAQSWQTLRALGVERIYPGHGPVYPLRPALS